MKANSDEVVLNLGNKTQQTVIVGNGQMLRSEDWLGPRQETESDEWERNATIDRIVQHLKNRKGTQMHYRNGREAKNGDKIVKLSMNTGKIESFGVLHSAIPGNDYCNGNIAVVQPTNDMACMVDCLHIDDVAEILTEKGLHKRPEGK